MKDSPSRSSIFSVPRPIWAIGFGVFFINTSSVMIRSVAAIYLKTILGVGMGWIGLLEGIVEAMSFIIKTFSGVLSDYFRRRKVFVMVGYGLVALSNPIIALCPTFLPVVIARIISRLGNGVQATPRDALVADIAPIDSRGACYGLRIGLGTAGSLVGAIIASYLMHRNNNDYQHLFWMATIPAVLAILILFVFVKEPEQNLHPKDHKPRHPIHWADLPRLGRPFWNLMGVTFVFMIAWLGEPLLAIHAHENFGLTAANIPHILIVLNIGSTVSAVIVGPLSDRMSRYQLLGFGFVILIVSDYIFATTTTELMMFIAVALCGLMMAIVQSMLMALVADTAPEDLRGTAFGVYYMITAISLLLANVMTGVIADFYGMSFSFFASLLVASLALALLLHIMPKGKKSAKKR